VTYRRCAELVCLVLLAQSCSRKRAAPSSTAAQQRDASNWTRALKPKPEGSTISITSSAFDKDGALYVHGTLSGSLTVDGSKLAGPPSGQQVAYAAKFSPSGQVSWLRDLGRSWSSSGKSIAVDASGAVWIRRSGALARSGTERRYDLLKLDGGTGDVLWSREVPANITVDAMSYDDAGDRLEGPALVGAVSDGTTFDEHQIHANESDMFVGMLSSSGEFRWVQSFGGQMPGGPNAVTALPPPRGGHRDHDRALDVTFRPDHTLAFLGRASFETTIGNTRYPATTSDQLILVGLRRNGSVAWSQSLGAAPTDRAPQMTVAGPQIFVATSRSVSVFRGDGVRVGSTVVIGDADKGTLSALAPFSGGGALVAGSFVGILHQTPPRAAQGASDVFFSTLDSDGRLLATKFRSDGDSYSVATVATSRDGRVGLGLLERHRAESDSPPYAALVEVSREP
jgi:hypothetical protein